MRSVFLFFLIIFLSAAVYYLSRPEVSSSLILIFSFSPCDRLIKYRLGQIDPRFNLSETRVLSEIEGALSIWERPASRKLFLFDDSPRSLSINLTYDERQSLGRQIGELEGSLKGGKTELDRGVHEYGKLVSDFNLKIGSLNGRIRDWNERGGAPPEEYARLNREGEDLRQEAERLNSITKRLNLSTDSLNSQIGQLNRTVASFNEAIAERPEEGLYDPEENRIDIYFNVGEEELRHTLAHELGHALGLTHLANPKAIMYAMSSRVIVASDDDVRVLTERCRSRSIFGFLRERLTGIKSLTVRSSSFQ